MPHGVDYVDVARAQRTILRRARFLPPRDAALVQNAVERNLPINQTARLLGLHPGTLARRVRRLLHRLSDPSIVLLLDHGDTLPPELRQLGIEHRLHGLSIRQLAEMHRITPYQVRAMLTQLQGCLRARPTR